MNCEANYVDYRNVLFLGQSGNGKTTTVNVLANYCCFSSWRDAIDRDEPVVLVPFQYEKKNDDGTKQIFRMGGVNMADAANEQTDNPELSCTQSPRVYTFLKDKKAFNFIDMPGFGDTAGAGQDEHHKKQRHNFLNRLTELHAIVVVVKSNQSRLSPPFESALTDVLELVPKSAVDNIMFLVTHGSSTDFENPLVESPLIEFLKKTNNQYEEKHGQKLNLSVKNNMYIVEYLAFKHLVERNRCEKFKKDSDENGHATIRLYWDKTREGLFAMMERVIKQKVISTESINEINQARHFIEHIVKLIYEVIEYCEKLKQPSHKAKTIELLEQMDVLHPRMVCSKCKTSQTQNGTNNHRICHQNCSCCPKAVPLKNGHLEIRKCSVFKNNQCKECRCSLSCHYYYVADRNAEAKKIIANLDEVLRQGFVELLELLKIANGFLQNNSIITFSESRQQRLTESIQRHEANGEMDEVDELTKVLEEYEKKMADISKTLQKVISKQHTFSEFKKQLEKAFQLKVIGSELKKGYDEYCNDNYEFEEPLIHKANIFPNWS